MSELKRFGELVNEQNDFEITECSDGIFVLYKDYIKLKTENERLRKAGDAMANSIIKLRLTSNYGYAFKESLPAWNMWKAIIDSKQTK